MRKKAGERAFGYTPIGGAIAAGVLVTTGTPARLPAGKLI
jgi:hypothetical protein